MSIRKKLQLGILATGGITLLVFGLILAWTSQQVSEAIEQSRAIDRVVRGVFELNIITHDYLLHHEERAQAQWQLRYGSLAQILTEVGAKDPAEEEILDQVIQNHAEIQPLFSQLVTKYEGQGLSELEQRLASQLAVKAQTMVADTFRLVDMASARAESAQGRGSFLLIASGVIVLTLMVSTFVLASNSVVARIANLQRGTEIIAAGDLDFQVDDGSPDEIGDLAHAFNEMTRQLRESYGKLKEEITERERAEEERERLLLAEREQRLLAELQREVAVVLNSSLDREEVLYLILNHLALILECDSATVMLRSGPELKVAAHWSSLVRDEPFIPPQIDTLPHVREVLKDRRPVIVPDTSSDENWQHLPGSEHIRCWMGAPLVVQDRVIGLLNLNRGQPDSFTTDDAELVAAVASQAGIAIQNARLFEEAHRRASHQEALSAIISAVAAASDLPELLEVTLDRVLKAVGLDMGAIWTADQSAVRGVPSEIRLAIAQPSQAADADTYDVHAVGDWQQEAVDSPLSAMVPVMARFGIRASLTIPLMAEGEYTGGLALASPRSHPWNPDEIALVEAVGQQLGTAMERLRLLEKTREQTLQLQNVISTVPEGILILDADLRVLLVNPTARRYLDALTDTSWGEVLTHLGGRPLAELLTSPPPGLWHEVTVDGPAPQTFEVIARPLEDGPETSGWVMVMLDVTQEREVQRRTQRQERLATVGQLAAGIAHDFNNIMAVIVLYAGTSMRVPGLPPRVKERLEIVSQQARRATDLINQILDFSRRAVLARQPMDLLPFLKEQVKLLERTVPEHIRIDLTHGMDEYMVNADPTRMQQVVMNLAVNARDAMPEGGELHIALERISIEARKRAPLPEMEAGQWMRLTVMDTGTGMSPEVLSHIFEPFFTTKAPGKGSGLGLAQVWGTVQQHEGHIDVTSRVGHGTTFTIYLPALSVSQPEDVTQEKLDLIRGQGETVLVVEDDAAAREALVDSLELLNYRVLAAAHGREALAIFERRGSEIALVLSDVVMPKMGGVALLHALRQRGWAGPMVLLTGHPMEEEGEGLPSEGVAVRLLKPVTVERLAQVVARVLKEDQVGP